MFCPKCGTQNASGSRFCGKCGAPVGSADNVYEAPYQQSSAPTGYDYADTPRPARSTSSGGLSGKAKLIGVIAAALVVALLGCWIFGVFGGGSYEKVVDKFFDSFIDADAEGIVECLPDEFMELAMEEEGATKRELIEELQYGLDEIFEYMPSGVKIKHEIVYTEDVRGEDLEYVKELYSEIGAKVTAAKVVEVELTISYMGMSESETIELGVVEIGGSWYIDVQSMEDMMDDFM